MSDPVSALNGRIATGSVRVEDAGPQGMVTLRGDLGDAKFTAAVEKVVGIPLPERGRSSRAEERRCLWMSPDELLVLVPYAEVGEIVSALGKALTGRHHLAVDVSDARTLLRVTGEDSRVRDALAKLSPADLRPARQGINDVRRTRMAQCPAALWFEGEGTASVICFRSVSSYVFGLLEGAAKTGAEVSYF